MKASDLRLTAACGKSVSVITMWGRRELVRALVRNADVRVMHLPATPGTADHIWSLADEEKARLQKMLAEGLV